ncbi:uncharacterized protein LOC117650825 [Thrips palmi]|uniref:Uncharacterized protein LOC117650825 n=1 Tax=Thrips palmi TaxID=161013 RepID=A0A6P8ZY37_THRPL|nr:uncharacterized protein LOC117650825 [Thrips palmi]
MRCLGLSLFIGVLCSQHALQQQYDWPERTESGVLEEAAMRRTYRLEDFLWTGSGDGEVEASPRPGGGIPGFTTTTVYKTTTAFATTTVLATPTPLYTTSLIITQVPRSPVGPISPTTSFPWPGEGSGNVPSTASPSWTLLNGSGPQYPDEAHDDSLPDPRFWLVTVLKANDTQDWHLATDLLEARLARLYKAAFLRQQERHLGIVNASALAALARLRRAPDVVRVTVHNVTTLVRGGSLYWVRVRGRPVPAATAAHDMRLISDHEMAAELGLPIITKAEPYLHAPVPLAARGRVRDVWLLVGAAGCGVALLLLRDKSSPGFLGVAGADRGGHGVSSGSGSASGSRSSFSCASSCSGSLSDAALVRRRGQHHPHLHAHHALHHAVNPALVDALHLTEDDVVVPHPRGAVAAGPSRPAPSGFKAVQVHQDALDVLDTGTSPAGPRRASPNSYLSMPSVKQFPRGVALPEPLTRVLEPVCVSNLDGDESMERVAVSPSPGQDVPRAARGPATPCEPAREPHRGVRHSSLEGDPGVLGPVVWGLRCQRITSAGGASDASGTGTTTLSDGAASPVSPPQVGRMRRRFHELLDDAFSLFAGSRSVSRSASQGSQDDDDSTSPVGAPVGDVAPRPKTSVTDARRPSTASANGSNGSPLSAGPFHRPQIDAAVILADSRLPPHDPAVPLIAAIKHELSKFGAGAASAPSHGTPHGMPLPGCTPPRD